ncbi:hypothetical protein [Kitasatospora sp. MBT63]|uniref:hypothetical protein n=1 Tax=Kitasatospora sp. MBT63 TaxID=1444768 RepID=UPI000539D07B|nr:hypothetical protein [Kitasatospora sp. MBT63]
MTDTAAEDTWVEQGQEISSPDQLRDYVAEIRAAVSHMQTGLGRAAWGALTGRAWLDTPADSRPNVPAIVDDHLEMTVTPVGTTAADAAFRQSLAALLAALDAVDRATLTVWLAQIAAQDPARTA